MLLLPAAVPSHNRPAVYALVVRRRKSAPCSTAAEKVEFSGAVSYKRLPGRIQSSYQLCPSATWALLCARMCACVCVVIRVCWCGMWCGMRCGVRWCSMMPPHTHGRMVHSRASRCRSRTQTGQERNANRRAWAQRHLNVTFLLPNCSTRAPRTRGVGHSRMIDRMHWYLGVFAHKRGGVRREDAQYTKRRPSVVRQSVSLQGCQLCSAAIIRRSTRAMNDACHKPQRPGVDHVKKLNKCLCEFHQSVTVTQHNIYTSSKG